MLKRLLTSAILPCNVFRFRRAAVRSTMRQAADRKNGSGEAPRTMLPTQASLFQLMSARMAWLGQRQVVLSHNLANDDTPDYRPRDLRETDFSKLARGVRGRPSRIAMATTDPLHVEGAPAVRLGFEGRPVDSEYETAPAGNAVILEEQMAKATQTALDYQLTINLYRKYLGMVRIALGTER